MTVKPQNFAGEGGAVDFYVTASGTAPTLENLSEIIFDPTGGSQLIKTTKGTKDITMEAKIAASDAAKAGLEGEVALTNATAEEENAYFTFTPDATDGKGTITFSGASKYAFKGLPITVTAKNRENPTGVSKTYKITVESDDPKWDVEEGTELVKAGVAYGPKDFIATVPLPFEIKLSPKEKTPKNGLQAVIDSTNPKKVTIKGLPLENKETKTPFTLTVTNTSTKQSATLKYTIQALVEPTIKTPAGKLDKEVIIGKKVSAKPAVNGSKGYTWAIDTTSAVKEDKLEEYGIYLDPAKGLNSNATEKVTVDSDGNYEPIVVKLKAINASMDEESSITYTAPTYDVKIGIKGVKPKLNTKNVSLKKGSIPAVILLDTTPKNDGTDDNVIYKFDMDDTIPGIQVDQAEGTLVIDESLLIATKGTTVPVTLNNAGSEATGKIKFAIDDSRPEIEDFTIEGLQSLAKSKVTKTVTVKVTDETCTGDTKIKWTITKAPRYATAKLKANGNGATATLTFTVAKGLKGTSDLSDSISITATNSRTGEVSTAKNVSFTVSPVMTALPEGSAIAVNEVTRVALPEATARKSAGEGEVKLGTTRTVAGLTAGENTIVHEEGYIVAAVLPEVTVTEDGQYDLNVELAETVKEGAELKYFAFPRNAEASDDDEIVDFYDDEGAEIEAVPDSHKITVAPWFNADVTYAPVIAVKADTGDEAAKTIDEIEEIVTVEETAK